jgi:hypothetical protein
MDDGIQADRWEEVTNAEPARCDGTREEQPAMVGVNTEVGLERGQGCTLAPSLRNSRGAENPCRSVVVKSSILGDIQEPDDDVRRIPNADTGIIVLMSGSASPWIDRIPVSRTR